MRISITSILTILLLFNKDIALCQSHDSIQCPTYEIQENKTILKVALHVLGREDFLYKTCAFGGTSGYTTQLYMFKKLGIAITSKTGLVDKIELLDTLKLPRYDDGFDALLPPTFQNIITLAGNPTQTLEINGVIELTYQNTGITFIVDKKTKKLINFILLQKVEAS